METSNSNTGNLINLISKDNIGKEIYDLMICKKCLHLYEVDPSMSKQDLSIKNPRKLYQKCQCKSRETGLIEETWKGFDFNTKVELCYCCSMVLINSGSKWSVFYCDECKDRVRAFNDIVGKVVIPLGRHSVMNSLMIEYKSHDLDVEISKFVTGWNSLVGIIDKIVDWSTQSLFQNLHDLGFRFDSDIRLKDYDECLPDLRIIKSKAFLNMLDFLRKHQI
jgi:hypothetical protein